MMVLFDCVGGDKGGQKQPLRCNRLLPSQVNGQHSYLKLWYNSEDKPRSMSTDHGKSHASDTSLTTTLEMESLICWVILLKKGLKWFEFRPYNGVQKWEFFLFFWPYSNSVDKWRFRLSKAVEDNQSKVPLLPVFDARFIHEGKTAA